MKYICKFCKTEKQSSSSLGGHVSFCVKNRNAIKNKRVFDKNRSDGFLDNTIREKARRQVVANGSFVGKNNPNWKGGRLKFSMVG